MKHNKSSRRAFLQTGSSVIASLPVLSAAVFPSVSRGANAAGSDLIKVALIGAGGRGRGAVIDRFAAGDNVKLVALADVHENRAKEGLELLKQDEKTKDKIDIPPERIFGGFNGYKNAVAEADLVIIASPPAFHPDHYLYSVEQGKHVFVEKPFGVDAEGYRRCMKANKIAEEKGLTVAAGFQRRHEQKYIDWISKIQDGFIGDIISTQVYWNCAAAKVRGVRGEGESEISFQVRDWYFFNWLSGDHLVEQHCHNVDIGNWIHGKGDPLAHPVSAQGIGGRQFRKVPNVPYNESGNLFDHHYVEYTYSDGTVLHSQCRQIPNCWNLVSEKVFGSAGRGQIGWLEPKSGERWNPKYKNDNGYVQEHIHQTDAIRSGKKLHNGWYAATSTMVGILGTLATYSGKEIKWDDAVANGVTLFPYNKELTFDTPSPVLPDKDGNYEHIVPVPGKFVPFDK